MVRMCDQQMCVVTQSELYVVEMDVYGGNGSWLYEYICGQTPTSIGVVPRRLGRSKNQLSLGQNVLSLRLLKFEGIGI